jgi:hypothetical protein
MRKFLLCISLLLIVFSGCKKTKIYPPVKVLILGNSVTHSPPDASMGWTGNWGMAASAPEKDYVHRFTAKLTALNSATTVQVKNIAEFESKFDTYNIAQNLQKYRDYNPDLLIVRIGENVLRTGEEVLFDKKYQELINYFTSKNPSLKVLAVGSVWPLRDFANVVMKRHSAFISMDFLQYDPLSYAFGMFPDYGVQTHPSDYGMKLISDFLYETTGPMLYPENY